MKQLECTLSVGIESNTPTVLVFYWCVTNYHKHWLKTTHIYYLIVSVGQKARHNLDRELICLVSQDCHQGVLRARFSPEAWGFGPTPSGLWKNSFTCGCRIHGSLLFQKQKRERDTLEWVYFQDRVLYKVKCWLE